MKKIIPLFLLFIIVAVFFRQFFLHGLLPIPSDTLVGLYHPFRDLYANSYPRGIPFKNFLITDPIRQQYPWRDLAISLEKHLQLPLWNPYNFSGVPLLANFQSAVWYPLNIIFFILPFATAWSVLVFLQPLLAGIFLYLYLRNIKLHPFASFLGALAFAFSGFSIAWMEWNTVFQTLLWVPLILLAKDKLVEKWSTKWMIVFFLAEICSFLAGHLQMLFYALCITNLYLFLRVWQKAKNQKGNIFYHYNKIYFPFFLVGVAMLVVTAIQWIPTLQFIFQSARSIDVNYLTTEGWFVPWQHLIQFIAPDFFGNPTTLNYWGVWNYGEFIGYIGLLPLVFSLFALIARHDKKTYFFGGVALVAFLFALPTPLAQLPFTLHIPLLSTAQPTRLIGIIDLALAILSALGFDYVLQKRNVRIQLFSVVTFLGIIFVGVWIFVIKFHPLTISPESLSVAKHNLVFPTIVFVSLMMIIILLMLFRKYIPLKIHYAIYIVLILITVIDQLRFADKFTPFTSSVYLYPSTAALKYLQDHLGDYRYMTTDSRILPPNVSTMYRLQSIEGYDPLYIERYGAFIAAMQRNKADISTPFGFNRIIVPHDTTSPLINLLGVKYILSFDDLHQNGLEKVFQEGQTIVYQNNYVLPRAFFVKSVISANDQQDAVNKVFQNKEKLGDTAIVEGLHLDGSLVGTIQIKNYAENSITLETENTGVGFLVLTDVYYPSWHVTVDGKETQIYITDSTFRGIVVPSGKHAIVFSDHLF